MKKTFLTLICAITTMCAATAQVNEQWNNAQFSTMSPNGKWLVESTGYNTRIYNRTTGLSYSYTADDDSYTGYGVGQGNCVTDNGFIAGSLQGEAGYWQDGEWSYLPVPSGQGTTFNCANAVTPDASRIVGNVGKNGAEIGDEDLILYPVLWTLQSDGSYECQQLPYPAKDFLGRTPQWVSALAISDDGKTIAGQVVDNTGYYNTIIIYSEDTDGNWSYRTVGDSEIYDAEKVSQIPPYPDDVPLPNARDYASDEELNAYNEALDNYNTILNKIYNGEAEWSELPKYPQLKDYLTGENKEKYEADYAAFEKANAQYEKDLEAYENALYEAVTGSTYYLNNIRLSANGLFVATTLDVPGASYWDANYSVPTLVDVATGSASRSNATDQAAFSIMNDGTMITASPALEYTRTSYVVKKGDKVPTPFISYLKERGADKAVEFLKANFTFNVTVTSYDNDGNEVKTTVPDSLVLGTVQCNPQGTIFLSFLTDNFTYSSMANDRSYLIDLNDDATSAIGSATIPDEEPAILRREYYDMAGKRIAAPRQGVYIERRVTANGTRTIKHIR